MKEIRVQGLRFGNFILSGILALLGFSSCSDNGGGACEYGTPYATYEIKGRVTDQDKIGIANTRLIVKELDLRGKIVSYSRPDTLFADQSGAYLRQYSQVTNEGKYRIVCEDPQNNYKSDSTEIQMNPTGGSGWYQGSDSKEVNFELKKKD